MNSTMDFTLVYPVILLILLVNDMYLIYINVKSDNIKIATFLIVIACTQILDIILHLRIMIMPLQGLSVLSVLGFFGNVVLFFLAVFGALTIYLSFKYDVRFYDKE